MNFKQRCFPKLIHWEDNTFVLFMPLLFGFIADTIHIEWYPIYLLIFAVLMLMMSERLNRMMVKKKIDTP